MIDKGVPQSCIHSPLLFNIMLSDFPTEKNDCEIALFADDVTAMKTGKSKVEIETQLQKLLKEIEEWAIKWRFTFSVGKCAALTFSRKRKETHNHQLKLSGFKWYLKP